MLEKGKISAFQMGMMMHPTIVATAILIVPSITAKYAKNDLWLSAMIASLMGFLTVYIANQLHKFYPKQTIIQYSESIIGRIPGKVLGFIYLFFYLQLNGIIVREYAEFLVGNFITQTPISIVIGSMIFICAFAVRGGIEVIARSAQIFVPINILSLVFTIFLLIPDLDVKNLFPIMEHGIMPAIKGAAVPQAWFTEFLLISFLLPFLTNSEKGMKWGMISVFAVMLTLVVTNLITLFLFGGNTASYVYPFMEAFAYISIADFFENLEAIAMANWVMGAFTKICVFYYAAVIGTAQWLNLSDYRPVVFPLGFLTVLFSFWDLPNFPEMVDFLSVPSPFYFLLIQTIIPVLLLVIAVLRKRNRQKSVKHR